MTCSACAEPLAEDAAQCVHCGERFGEREPIATDGYGRDSLLIATLCVVTAIVATVVLL